MDGYFFLKIIWVSAAVLVLIAVLIVLWRFKGLSSWKKSLKKELKQLKKSALEPGQQKGIQIIEKRCTEVFQSFSPELSELRDIPQFIISIATCFHPQAERPELEIMIGPCLKILEKSLSRFDCILERSAFNRLKSMNIRHIQNIQEWYLRFSNSRIFRWYIQYRKKLGHFFLFRLFFFPDPFSWLVYFSNRLTTLITIKYLMVDIYLFLGQLAIEAYSDQPIYYQEEDQETLEAALETLDTLEEKEIAIDPQIYEIRNRLTGISTIFISTPGLGDWKNAVYDAALIISKKYFPDSDTALKEAALGPLLKSVRAWINTFSKAENYPLIRRFYKMRLRTLYRVKNFSDNFLPPPIRSFVKNTLKTYGWLKWPLRIYRWAKNVSPWKIALDVGWTAAKKAAMVRFYGKTFDKACDELENIYFQSHILTIKKRKK